MEIAETVKRQVLQQGVLKPMLPLAEGAKSYELPAYVRYDLIAQTYHLRGKTDEVMAQQFISASWATRMELGSLARIMGQELMRKVQEWETSQENKEGISKQKNAALCQVQQGRKYAEAARSSAGETRLIAALAAVSTLRTYGENPEVQNMLPVLKSVMPGEQYAELERFVNDAIAREQGFQSKALLLLEKVLPTKEDRKQRATLTYLCGELHRRLGHWDKAESYYTQFLETESHPEWLDQWAKEQRDLLPK